jgi:hypothetical protein
MKHFFAGLVTVLALSSPALAQQVVGPLPVTALRGTGINEGCAKVQVGAAGPWYAMSNTQQGYQENYALLVAAATTGQQIVFKVEPVALACALPQIGWVEIGNEH